MNDMQRLLNKTNEAEELREELRRVSRENIELKGKIGSLERKNSSLEHEVQHLNAELRGYRQGWMR